MFTSYNVVLSWILRVIALAFGLFGNFMVFLVFQKFKKTPFRYITLVAIDTINLFINLAKDFSINLNFDFINLIEFWCRTFYYLITVFSSVSAWLLVFISLAKTLSIRKPKIKIIKKKYFQIAVIFGTIALNFLY